MNILFWGIVLATALFLFLAAITSCIEKENRAGTILTIGATVFLLIKILSAYSVENNLLFRRMAVKLGDVFYGRKPPARGLPPCLNYTNNP